MTLKLCRTDIQKIPLLRNCNKKLIEPKILSLTTEELWLYMNRSIVTMKISHQKEPARRDKRRKMSKIRY